QYFIWYSSTVDFAVGALEVEEMRANSRESSATGGSAGVALANAYIELGMCLALLGEIERAREAFAQARERYRNPFGRALTIDAEFASFNLPYFADQPDLLDREAAESLRHVTSAIDEGVVLGGIYSLASV